MDLSADKLVPFWFSAMLAVAILRQWVKSNSNPFKRASEGVGFATMVLSVLRQLGELRPAALFAAETITAILTIFLMLVGVAYPQDSCSCTTCGIPRTGDSKQKTTSLDRQSEALDSDEATNDVAVDHDVFYQAESSDEYDDQSRKTTPFADDDGPDEAKTFSESKVALGQEASGFQVGQTNFGSWLTSAFSSLPGVQSALNTLGHCQLGNSSQTQEEWRASRPITGKKPRKELPFSVPAAASMPCGVWVNEGGQEWRVIDRRRRECEAGDVLLNGKNQRPTPANIPTPGVSEGGDQILSDVEQAERKPLNLCKHPVSHPAGETYTQDGNGIDIDFNERLKLRLRKKITAKTPPSCLAACSGTTDGLTAAKSNLPCTENSYKSCGIPLKQGIRLSKPKIKKCFKVKNTLNLADADLAAKRQMLQDQCFERDEMIKIEHYTDQNRHRATGKGPPSEKVCVKTDNLETLETENRQSLRSDGSQRRRRDTKRRDGQTMEVTRREEICYREKAKEEKKDTAKTLLRPSLKPRDSPSELSTAARHEDTESESSVGPIQMSGEKPCEAAESASTSSVDQEFVQRRVLKHGSRSHGVQERDERNDIRQRVVSGRKASEHKHTFSASSFTDDYKRKTREKSRGVDVAECKEPYEMTDKRRAKAEKSGSMSHKCTKNVFWSSHVPQKAKRTSQETSSKRHICNGHARSEKLRSICTNVANATHSWSSVKENGTEKRMSFLSTVFVGMALMAVGAYIHYLTENVNWSAFERDMKLHLRFIYSLPTTGTSLIASGIISPLVLLLLSCVLYQNIPALSFFSETLSCPGRSSSSARQ
jgi:hypothetical protein